MIPALLLVAALVATPFVAMAATPSSGMPAKTASMASGLDTQTIIHIPLWQVGDKAAFLTERIVTREGMAEPISWMETPHFRARLEVEVISESDDGKMIHRWRIAATPASIPSVADGLGLYSRNLPIPQVPIDLAVTEDSDILEVVNLTELIRQSRELYETASRERQPELWAHRPAFHYQLVDDMFHPVRFQAALLEVLSPPYILGSGELQGDEGRSLPTTRKMTGSDVVLQGVEHQRIEVSARDRTASITSAQVFSTDGMPEGLNKWMETFLKDEKFHSAESRELRLNRLRKDVAEEAWAFSQLTTALADDAQAWPRQIVSRRIFSSANKGKKSSISVENRLERVDAALPSASPAAQP